MRKWVFFTTTAALFAHNIYELQKVCQYIASQIVLLQKGSYNALHLTGVLGPHAEFAWKIPHQHTVIMTLPWSFLHQSHLQSRHWFYYSIGTNTLVTCLFSWHAVVWLCNIISCKLTDILHWNDYPGFPLQKTGHWIGNQCFPTVPLWLLSVPVGTQNFVLCRLDVRNFILALYKQIKYCQVWIYGWI